MASIPLVDIAELNTRPWRRSRSRAGRQVLAKTAFIAGPQVAAFESEYAAFTGARHCVGVANGTDAIEIALRALGVRPRRRSASSRPTPSSRPQRRCRRAGATPVLVDCADDETYLIDAGRCRRRR